MIDTNGTSFHGHTIRVTVRMMTELLGDPTYVNNSGTDKVNIEWDRKNDLGDVFTVYDWKEDRVLADDDMVEWHIGAHTSEAAERSRDEIVRAIRCFG